jgi:dTDP-4-dehydrorhamnose reductase
MDSPNSVMSEEPVLVTGLSGMVGSRFQELYPDRYRFENLDLSAGIDITQAGQIDPLIGSSKASAVLHLAAYTNVSAAYEEAGDQAGACYQVNVVGTENIAKACKKYGKYLIHISTDFVFDGAKEEPYTEADPPHPIEWYGQTKFLAEQAVQESLDDWLILRLAYPYQAHPVRPDFVKNLIEKLTAGTLPPAFTDHTITPTFADDIAAVFDYCLKKRPTGIYHLVGSSWHTDYEIAGIVKKTFNLPGSVQAGQLQDYLKTIRRPYQKTMKVSNSKLQAEFGLKLRTFTEGLQSIKNQK